MGIWWAAGFSTAAIRIIDDDARGVEQAVVALLRCCLPVTSLACWYATCFFLFLGPCVRHMQICALVTEARRRCAIHSGLPIDGGDVNKFIQILRSERLYASETKLLGRPLGYSIFSLLALIRDPIY